MTASIPLPSAKLPVSLIGGPQCGAPTYLATGPHGAPPPVLPHALGTYHRGGEREFSAQDGALRWKYHWVPIPWQVRKAAYCRCANGGCPVWTHREAA